MTLRVEWDQDARKELLRLPVAERRAVMNAIAKLEVFGDRLGAPHTSQVKGSRVGIRELRPRSGRSPWRALYRRVAGAMVVVAVGPEAEHDRRGFDQAVREAEERLREIEG
ncbi:MAG: type II toxin-antitoxin system RelE/ParE family toxin [Nocardioidaceae bacterium]